MAVRRDQNRPPAVGQLASGDRLAAIEELARVAVFFWSIPATRVLLLAVVGTQIGATLIAVCGAFMPSMDGIPEIVA